MQEVIQKTIDYYVWVSGPFNWGGRWYVLALGIFFARR